MGGAPQARTAALAREQPASLAPPAVATSGQHWLRFTSDQPPLSVELAVEVQAVAGPPAAWAVCLVDQVERGVCVCGRAACAVAHHLQAGVVCLAQWMHGQNRAPPPRISQVTSQSPDELGVVQCGQPFELEIEALDRFSNRCTGGAAAGIPAPAISLDSDDRPLQYDEQEWEQGWVAQGDEHVYSARLTLSGHPGPVKLTVSDAAGEDGSALMQPDSLEIELRAGAASGLAVEGPATLECGTRAVLPQLRVFVVDAGGNPATSDSFEVRGVRGGARVRELEGSRVRGCGAFAPQYRCERRALLSACRWPSTAAPWRATAAGAPRPWPRPAATRGA